MEYDVRVGMRTIVSVDSLESAQARAPWEPGAARLTLLVGQYWENARRTLSAADAVRSGGSGWQAASLIFYSQISQWYLVCGVYNLFFCNRNEMKGIGDQETKRLYRTETSDFVSAAEPVCSKDNVHCFMASNSFDPGQEYRLTPMNQV